MVVNWKRLTIVLAIVIPGIIITAYYGYEGNTRMSQVHEQEDDPLWYEGKRMVGISQIALVLTIVGCVLAGALTRKGKPDPVTVTEKGFDIDIYSMKIAKPYYREYDGSKYRITRLDNDHIEFTEIE